MSYFQEAKLRLELRAGLALMDFESSRVAKKAKMVVRGQLPTEGGAIMITNHESSKDGPILFAMGRQFGRIIHPVVKHTLLHPGLAESEAVLARTGKQADDLNSGKKTLKSRLQALALRGAGAIEIDRDGASRDTIRQIDADLTAGHVVGISFYETRHPVDDLRAAMPAAAMVIKRNPEVPVYMVGLVGTIRMEQVYVNIDEPFTYRQLIEQSGKRTLKHDEVTHILAGRLASLLPDELKREWLKNPTLLPRSNSKSV